MICLAYHESKSRFVGNPSEHLCMFVKKNMFFSNIEASLEYCNLLLTVIGVLCHFQACSCIYDCIHCISRISADLDVENVTNRIEWDDVSV